MKYLYLFTLMFVLSCVRVDSKSADLVSPCAGCDDRTTPQGNLKYTV